jgi:hypothetical protein
MRSFWGPAAERGELGVVAEHCPFCHRTTPCTVQASYLGWYVCFVKLLTDAQKTCCRCSACGASFPRQLWRYADLLPAAEAESLSIDELLARTNPSLAERLQWKQQVCDLGGDASFVAAYEGLDEMRPGRLHSGLLRQLRDWARLGKAERAALVERVGSCARAWQLARQMAPTFPTHAGSLPALLAAVLVWSALLWIPFRGWKWGALTVVVGCAVAALVRQLFLARQVRRWTLEVLVPEARRVNVSLACFLAVVEDLPGDNADLFNDLWPVRDQVEIIRKMLSLEGCVEGEDRTPPSRTPRLTEPARKSP